MRSLIIDIQLPRDEYLRVYQDYIRQVKAVARSGESVRFPVSVLQKFVAEDGVRGTFELFFDNDNKFVEIVRI
ncbi:MAG: DUF2835 family protein [Pseudomonadales bacterium]|nr:DUF2835 family protein [Pseudomonadales bacterium]